MNLTTLAAEVTRFSTLAGRMLNDALKYTRAVRTGPAQYEIECSACGQGHRDGPFMFQPDATAAARAHADRCLA